MSSVVTTISVSPRLIVIFRVFTIILQRGVLFLRMSTLAKFNQVEEALKAKIESVLGAGRVAVGLYAPPPQFPRARLIARSVSVDEGAINMRRMKHSWTFTVILEHVTGDAEGGYRTMKQLFWGIYDAIMADRTLGLGDVIATPAVTSTLEPVNIENRYGFMWEIEILVKTEI